MHIGNTEQNRTEQKDNKTENTIPNRLICDISVVPNPHLPWLGLLTKFVVLLLLELSSYLKKRSVSAQRHTEQNLRNRPSQTGKRK